jgi:hypothetical protein
LHNSPYSRKGVTRDSQVKWQISRLGDSLHKTGIELTATLQESRWNPLLFAKSSWHEQSESHRTYLHTLQFWRASVLPNDAEIEFTVYEAIVDFVCAQIVELPPDGPKTRYELGQFRKQKPSKYSFSAADREALI